MHWITPPTTPQRCNRGSRSSLPLGGRINFQPFKLEQSAKAALSSLHSDGYRQVHPTSPSNFNTQPTSNPDSCWRRNPPVLVSLSPTCTASAVSVRDCVTDRLAGHADRIASPLSSLGFAGVPCPPSSSAIDRGSSFIRCGSFIRSPRTRWRLGVGAAASSRWAFWVPHTRRRVLVTSAGRSPFIRCASFTGNAHSRATSRIVCHRKDQLHPSFIPFALFPHPLGVSFRRAVISRAEVTSRRFVSPRGHQSRRGYFSAFRFAARLSVAPKLLLGVSFRRAVISRAEVTSRRFVSPRGHQSRRGYFSATNPKSALYPALLRRPHPPTKTPSLGFYRVFGWFGFGWLENFIFGTLYQFVPSGFYPVFSKIGICGKRKLQSI